MKPSPSILGLLGCFAISIACGGGGGESSNSTYTPLGEELAGVGSISNSTDEAFNKPFPSISNLDRITFESGDFVFGRAWVPSQEVGNDSKDGLGPLFNAESCNSCHVSDGRSRPPEVVSGPLGGLLLRLSIQGTDDHGGPVGDPNYGGQFNDQALSGQLSEGSISIDYTTISGNYDDGTSYELTKPTYGFSLLNYGATSENLMVSPRTAPALMGIGFLDAISESDILEQEDINDSDGDGISGKANRVYDFENDTTTIGRMGWKAEKASIRQQSAGAFNGDIGATSNIFSSHDLTDAQSDLALLDDGTESGETYEVKDDDLDNLVFYMQRLAVPNRRDVTDTDVLAGEALFYNAQCHSCHTPSYTLGTVTSVPEFSNQTIHPFTDMLLHDMGEELSDNRPVFDAEGNEWRTPPLWGIGLVETVNGHTRFLHDGRARNLEEAILWHGGEAEPSANVFKSFSSDQRSSLISFLESL